MRTADRFLHSLANYALGREWPRAFVLCGCIYAALRIHGGL